MEKKYLLVVVQLIDINVQIILEKLGGGGHITLAGAQIEGMSMEEVKSELVKVIQEYFIDSI